MQNKDKGDGIEGSPLDILLVILLEGVSMEVSWLVTPSSTAANTDLKTRTCTESTSVIQASSS